jgi:predicted metal-dependent hydrolase
MPSADRSRTPRKRRPGEPAQRARTASPVGRPVQLELFGPQTQALPRTAAAAPQPRRSRRAEGEARKLDLLRRLNRFADGKVSDVSLHDNRRVILSVRADRGGTLAPLRIRIHRSFVAAPEEVLRAVAEFVQSRNGSSAARQALGVIRQHFHLHRPAGVQPVSLDPVGVCFDLRHIVDDLNERFFGARLAVDVTWGRAPRSGCHRRSRSSTIQLGSYAYEDRLVRIHRVLDDPRVPRFVVEAVVYHELLHADMPPVQVNGRQYFHTPEFRRRERLFRSLERADLWIQENLGRLLRRRRSLSAKDPRRR